MCIIFTWEFLLCYVTVTVRDFISKISCINSWAWFYQFLKVHASMPRSRSLLNYLVFKMWVWESQSSLSQDPVFICFRTWKLKTQTFLYSNQCFLYLFSRILKNHTPPARNGEWHSSWLTVLIWWTFYQMSVVYSKQEQGCK